MEKRRIGNVDREVDSATVKRPLTDPLGAEHVALNYYELDPGESFAYGYHRHDDQEEVFLVRQGTATFETEDGEVDVGPDEVIRFAPGEFQQGTNRGDQRVIALAIGAPPDSRDVVIRRYCETCGERTEVRVQWADDEQDAKITVCLECGSETDRYY